jgi:hypothetical protein
MTLVEWLAAREDRCEHGYHATQNCPSCTPVAPASEWSLFTAALKTAARADGTVHACDVRPLTHGRIEPRRLSALWKRARREGLLTEAGHERSDDVAGRNSHRMEAYYELRGAA